MSEENVRVVRSGYEAWNRGDMEAMLATLHPDIELVTAGLFLGLAPVYLGHEDFRNFYRDFTEPWDSVQIHMNEARDADDRVVALITFHAKGRDGLEVRRQFANLWTFQDGLGIRLQSFADWAEALEAAGLSG